MDEIQGQILAEIAVDAKQNKYSPTTGCSVPQNFIEDVLVKALKKSQHSELNFATELMNFSQHEDHIVCQLLDKNTNKKYEVACEYLIAADGAHSSIRNALNIPMLGVPSLGTYLTIYAHADLSLWLKDKQAVVYTLASKSQMGHFLMAVDHIDKWIFGKYLEDPATKITPDYCNSVIQSFVNGKKIPLELISSSTWDMAALNAEKYQNGRIFLVGDAAHRLPPTGGMGMNTGFAGAQNLAWKLGYVLNNYADESLLKTYEEERQPVATYTLEWASRNAKRIFNMLDAYRKGDLQLFQELAKDQDQHVNHTGLDLGMVYLSGAIYSENHAPVAVDANTYNPASTPGMRAPHCEIMVNGKSQSILNLFQDKYVLLLSQNAQVSPNSLPIPASYPLKSYRHKVDFADINNDYVQYYNLDTYQAILVRPDGHIAFRMA